MKYEIELICLGSIIVEVKARSLKEARKKALKKIKEHDLNAYIDCVKILIKEEHEVINSETFKTSFTTLEVD
jgi:xanthine dehydrogenase molybdopterin-binding subunit B